MITKANRRRRQFMSGRLPVASLTVAATLLGLSEVALAGDGAADPTQAQSGNAASQALLKKMDAMEQRIRSLESQLKQKDAPPRAKAAAETAADGKPRSKTSRTVDLAASAPAGDAAAETPPASQKGSPDQPDKSLQPRKSDQVRPARQVRQVHRLGQGRRKNGGKADPRHH